MKKIFIFIAILIGIFAVVQCSKPTITKEQQENIAVRIYRNYDIQEIEFLSFTKNDSTGTYNLRIRLNKKETILVLNNLNILEKSEGKMSLDPLEKFEDIRRPNIINGKLGELNIKITYIGEK